MFLCCLILFFSVEMQIQWCIKKANNCILLYFSFEMRTVLFLSRFHVLYSIVKSSLYLVWINFVSSSRHSFFLIDGFFHVTLDFMNPKTRNPGDDIGTMDSPWHISFLAYAIVINFFKCWRRWFWRQLLNPMIILGF